MSQALLARKLRCKRKDKLESEKWSFKHGIQRTGVRIQHSRRSLAGLHENITVLNSQEGTSSGLGC
jgi:hypothetical protein